MSSFHTFFKKVLYWCLELTRHNIGIPLKHTKYIFDIPLPFSHHLYLSTTFKECFTGFACEVNPRPYCLQVSTTPNSYVSFYWSVILILNSGPSQQVFAN